MRSAKKIGLEAKELAGRVEPREDLEEMKQRLRDCDSVVMDDRDVPQLIFTTDGEAE